MARRSVVPHAGCNAHLAGDQDGIDAPRHRFVRPRYGADRTAVVLDVDRRAVAALVVCLGLVGFWIFESSSDFLWPTAWPAAWPAAWRPGSLAGQNGPEGSTW